MDRFNSQGDGETLSGIDFLKAQHDVKHLSRPAVVRLAVATGSPPNYRTGDAAQQCGTCSFLLGAKCTKYNLAVDLASVCDDWAARPVSAQDETTRRLTGPYKPDGEPAIDAIQSPMTENPAYNNPQGPAGISS